MALAVSFAGTLIPILPWDIISLTTSPLVLIQGQAIITFNPQIHFSLAGIAQHNKFRWVSWG